MKGCLKLSSQDHPGSPCISRTPSSASHDESPTVSFDPSASTPSTSTSTSTPSQSGSSTPPTTRSRKCVDFGKEICAEFFVADEWDRTPTEPARKLTYQDLLELKEIQRSLPRANQPPDAFAGRAAKCYLRAVPIGLLPLLPDSNPATPMSTPTGTPTGEPQRNPLSASNSPVGSGTSSPMRGASPERGQSNDNDNSTNSNGTNPPWCVNFHRVRAPPPPVAPAYAPSLPAAPSLVGAGAGSRFAKFPYPPSPLHRGATPEPVQDKRLAHLLPGRQAPPRKRPMFAFLPLLDAGGGVGDGAVGDDAQEEKKEGEGVGKAAEQEKGKEKEKENVVKEEPKTPMSTPTPTVLTSTRDASREREEDDGTQVEPEWPRHVYGFSSSKSASPTSPTASRSPVVSANSNFNANARNRAASGSGSGWSSASAPPTTVSFKRAPPSDAGKYYGGFGGGYSGYVPPPPVRMVAASGLGMPIKSLTANSHLTPNPKAEEKDTDTHKDEGAYYGSHVHPYSPGSSRTGSVAGSRSASVERGGERRLYAPHAMFAAALLRVDELVQRAAAADAGTDADAADEDVDGVDEDARGHERLGRSEEKAPRKSTRKAKKEKEKRFIMVNDMQIELDGSDDEEGADAAAEDDDVDDDAHGGVEVDPGMGLKAALEAPATPPTVYAYQLPTPTPTPPPMLSSAASTATATPVNSRSPAKTPMPASGTSSSSSSSCLMGETAGDAVGGAGAGASAGPTVDMEPVRATTPTPINVMEPIRFKRAVPPSQMRRS